MILRVRGSSMAARVDNAGIASRHQAAISQIAAVWYMLFILCNASGRKPVFHSRYPRRAIRQAHGNPGLWCETASR